LRASRLLRGSILTITVYVITSLALLALLRTLLSKDSHLECEI